MDAGSPRGGPPEGHEPDSARAARTMVRYSALGFQVVLTFAVLTWLGAWCDRRYSSGPWGTLAGVGLGIVALFTVLLREGRKDPAARGGRGGARPGVPDGERGDERGPRGER
jgi:hypothetical protein